MNVKPYEIMDALKLSCLKTTSSPVESEFQERSSTRTIIGCPHGFENEQVSL